MFKKSVLNLIALLVVLSLALTACGGTAATEPVVDTGEKVTSTGYVCPEPEFSMEGVTSTEINIFGPF